MIDHLKQLLFSVYVSYLAGAWNSYRQKLNPIKKWYTVINSFLEDYAFGKESK